MNDSCNPNPSDKDCTTIFNNKTESKGKKRHEILSKIILSLLLCGVEALDAIIVYNYLYDFIFLCELVLWLLGVTFPIFLLLIITQ